MCIIVGCLRRSSLFCSGSEQKSDQIRRRAIEQLPKGALCVALLGGFSLPELRAMCAQHTPTTKRFCCRCSLYYQFPNLRWQTERIHTQGRDPILSYDDDDEGGDRCERHVKSDKGRAKLHKDRRRAFSFHFSALTRTRGDVR